MDLDSEGEGFDTVGGFVYQRLGKLPIGGDEVEPNGRTATRPCRDGGAGASDQEEPEKKELPPPSNGNGSNHK